MTFFDKKDSKISLVLETGHFCQSTLSSKLELFKHVNTFEEEKIGLPREKTVLVVNDSLWLQ